MSTLIEVHGLVKTSGRGRALDGLDLAVAAGEVHGFLGPNGSGKSTTARTAARSRCSAATRGAMPPRSTAGWPTSPVT